MALALAGGFLTLYHQGSPVLLFFFNLATLNPSWRLTLLVVACGI